MPRRMPTPEVHTFSGPNGLTAAAVRLTHTANGKTKKLKRPPAWYKTAWGFYDTTGEYRYACSWVGNLLSRAELQVWEDGKLTKNADAIAAMESFFGGVDGQREMLRQTGIHLTVPGDVYLVGEDGGEEPDKWSVVSANRITNIGRTETSPGKWKVGDEELTDPVVIRLWRPHPNKQDDADSPSRAVLPILTELENLSKMVASQIASRLSGAGILLVPNEMTFGSIRDAVKNGDGTDTSNSAGVNAFLQEFMETIMLGIEDPSDPAARTPILLQGPGEHLDKIKLLTIWSELQEQASTLRTELIRRLALGMDMPPEILTGSGELNHWNAWQVEEASIKAHTEPLLHIITAGITTTFLRPFLVGSGMSVEEARRFTVHADTTKIRLRPNRSKEALELYDRAILSEEATARENGFDTADLMDDKQRTNFYTRKVAAGSTTPELVAHALNLLGIPIPIEMIQVQEVPTEAPQPRSLQEHPERPIPDVQDAEVAAANVVVFRALERAGAKLRTKYPQSLVAGGDKVANDKLYRYAKVDNAEVVDDLLAGAWDCVDSLGLATAPAVLDTYVRHLLTTNRPHTPEFLAAHLRSLG